MIVARVLNVDIRCDRSFSSDDLELSQALLVDWITCRCRPFRFDGALHVQRRHLDSAQEYADRQRGHHRVRNKKRGDSHRPSGHDCVNRRQRQEEVPNKGRQQPRRRSWTLPPQHSLLDRGHDSGKSTRHSSVCRLRDNHSEWLPLLESSSFGINVAFSAHFKRP